MTVPAWHVINWSRVPIAARVFRSAYANFTHLGTHIDEEAAGTRSGQALWCLHVGKELVGLAFDWTETTPGVAVLSDPMQILSNVALLDDRGQPLDESARIVELNTAVHEIDWQHQISIRHWPTQHRLAA